MPPTRVRNHRAGGINYKQGPLGLSQQTETLNLPCPCLMKGRGKLREDAGKRSRRDIVMREENSKRVLSI